MSYDSHRCIKNIYLIQGMFPWAMLATMFCFCKADSFKKLIAKFPFSIFQVEPAHKNTGCVNTNDISDIRLVKVVIALLCCFLIELIT